ncbi:MAG: hypothetical protein ACT4PQ_15210 [Betaproteobacteria bacterium]
MDAEDAEERQEQGGQVLVKFFHWQRIHCGESSAAQAFNAFMARAGTRWDSAAILQVIEDMNGRMQ